MIVKICGLSQPEHALAAATAGADLIGLVFAPSRRRIAPDQAAALVQVLRQHPAGTRVGVVGLFVNEQPATINAISAQCGLDYVQLSGDETPAQAAGIDRPLIKSLRFDDQSTTWLAQPDQTRMAPWPWLVDAHVPGSYGGTGTLADWERAATLARQHPLLLAGGLRPDNVGQAIRQVQPRGVDVSSGVEHNGHKASDLIAAFVQAARAASRPTDQVPPGR
jgi:phosphoribosylanthranilate isomerase